MKILHVVYDASYYGITTFLLSLLESQRESYRDSEVAVAFHAEGPCMEDYKRTDVRTYEMGARSARDIALIIRFYRLFREYDIINLHTYSPWALLVAKLARKKVVFIFHGATGLRGGWTDIFKRAFYHLFLERYVDKITFASHASLLRYKENIGPRLKENKLEVFPYGMKIEGVRPLKPRDAVRTSLGTKGKFVVGTAARMDPVKRIERSIEAFVLLPDRENYMMLIAGEGSSEYERYLKKLVQTYGLEEQVIFLGYRKDIHDIINSMDLFVLPSSSETFGLALLEAMAMGVPSAVFSDGGGTVDITAESGIIVNTPQELRDNIVRLSNDNVFREKISRSVKKRAGCFDIRHTTLNLEQIYRSLLEE
jgi:glycosyltransferase involved in cell wall biosynthesis